MSETHKFTPEEEKRIEEIVNEALKIKDEAEREAFIVEQCCENLKTLEIVKRDVLYFLEKEESDDSEEDEMTEEFDMIGEEIGNYRIIEKISSGGFATVYRAQHKVLGNFVAIKIFDKPDITSNEDALRSWKNDLKSLSKFDHDNIVQFYDAGIYEKDGLKLPYIIEELIQGLHINKYCGKKDLSIREILSFFITLCKTIEFIHDENILHLDIKPNNILITTNRPPRIKVLDFGSSKLLFYKKRPTGSDYFNPLTLLCAAPEQFDKDELPDKQTDIYSLGVLLYLLLTEEYPFDYEKCSPETFIEKVINAKIKLILPSERILDNEEIEEKGHSKNRHSKIFKGDLDAIVKKSLEKRRKYRYRSVKEFRQDLENFLKEKPVSARKKNLSYYVTRAFSRFFRIKRERFGWNKWKTPLLRLVLFLSLLLLLLFFLNKYFTEPKLTVEKNTSSFRTRINDETQDKIFNVANLRFDGTHYFTFLEISGGSFEMGKAEIESFGNQTENENSLPHRTVNVGKFYLGRFEVTRKQWNLVFALPKVNRDIKSSDTRFISDSLPATDISYAEALEFCERLAKELSRQYNKEIIVRLPTEAEWEYACRANTTKKYGGGDKENKSFMNARISFDENKWKDASEWEKDLREKMNFMLSTNEPLGSSKFDSNPFGLLAMNGNVWEMTSDSWHDNYSHAPTDGSAWDKVDALNPEHKEKKFVLRGGAYGRDAYMAQCSYRTNGRFTSTGNDQTGFRIVIEAKSVDEIIGSSASPSK